jgi:phosphate-selective porin OprO/OprP
MPVPPAQHAIASLLFLSFLLPTLARAQTPSVRVGELTVKPYVLLQLDEGGTFGQSRGGGQATGFNVRRARVGAQARVADQLQLGLIYDFGSTPGGASRLYEADIAYTGLRPFIVRAGVFKPAFTLEYAQSAADLLFLERASIVNIVGGLVAGAGRVGGQIGATGERWFTAALVTGGLTGPGAQSDQRAVLARAAGLAIKTDDLALHLGVSGAWLYQVAQGGNGARSLRFSNQPELQIDVASPSLSTGSLAAQGARIAGVEAGFGWGGLWLQSEWYGIGVERTGLGARDPVFSGWYAQAAYTLVGKPRKWTSDTAAWGRPSPKEKFNPAAGSWGAVEVGARFSVADLNDAGVRGGHQEVWTTGVSWFPTEELRIALQYEHAEITGGSTPRRLSALAVRGQLRF